MIRRASALGIVALALVATACPKGSTTAAVVTPDPTHASTPSIALGAIPSVPPGGAATAAEAMKELCVPPITKTTAPPKPTVTPPQIAEVEREVEQVRGLEYIHPVAVQEITDAQIDRKLAAAFKDTYPITYYARRSAAWGTIGVIPPGTDLRAAIKNFESGAGRRVLRPGFEAARLRRLRRCGHSRSRSGFTLAHELTHALDDQHFDLRRLDAIAAACKDENFQAALGAIEGNAQYTAAEVLLHDAGRPGPGRPDRLAARRRVTAASRRAAVPRRARAMALHHGPRLHADGGDGRR